MALQREPREATQASPEQEYCLVRAGELLCALPHGDAGVGRFLLTRIAPWRMPVPIPGMPRGLVLGVAPLPDEEGIEHIQAVLGLAFALGGAEPPDGDPSPGRRRGACILRYSNGTLVAGIAVDSVVRRVRAAPEWERSTLPFRRGLLPGTADAGATGVPETWHVVDVDALLLHLARALRAPGVT